MGIPPTKTSQLLQDVYVAEAETFVDISAEESSFMFADFALLIALAVVGHPNPHRVAYGQAAAVLLLLFI